MTASAGRAPRERLSFSAQRPIGAGGELVGLTEDDVRLWMFWLGLDDVLHR